MIIILSSFASANTLRIWDYPYTTGSVVTINTSIITGTTISCHNVTVDSGDACNPGGAGSIDTDDLAIVNVSMFDNGSIIRRGNTSWAITAVNNSINDYYNHSITCVALTGSADLCDGSDDGSGGDTDNLAIVNVTMFDNITIVRTSNSSWFYNLYYGIGNRWVLANFTSALSGYLGSLWTKANFTAENQTINSALALKQTETSAWKLSNFTSAFEDEVPVCSAGDFLTADGTDLSCDTPVGGGGGGGASKWLDYGTYLIPNSTFADDIFINGSIVALDWSNATDYAMSIGFDTSHSDDFNWANNLTYLLDNKTIIRQTNTSWAIKTVNDSINTYYNHSITCATLTGSADLCDGNDASGGDTDNLAIVNVSMLDNGSIVRSGNITGWDFSSADDWQLANYTTENASITAALSLKHDANGTMNYTSLIRCPVDSQLMYINGSFLKIQPTDYTQDFSLSKNFNTMVTNADGDHGVVGIDTLYSNTTYRFLQRFDISEIQGKTIERAVMRIGRVGAQMQPKYPVEVSAYYSTDWDYVLGDCTTGTKAGICFNNTGHGNKAFTWYDIVNYNNSDFYGAIRDFDVTGMIKYFQNHNNYTFSVVFKSQYDNNATPISKSKVYDNVMLGNYDHAWGAGDGGDLYPARPFNTIYIWYKNAGDDVQWTCGYDLFYYQSNVPQLDRNSLEFMLNYSNVRINCTQIQFSDGNYGNSAICDGSDDGGSSIDTDTLAIVNVSMLDNSTIVRSLNTTWFYNLYYSITNRWGLANYTAQNASITSALNLKQTESSAWKLANQTAREAAYFDVANNASGWDMATADDWNWVDNESAVLDNNSILRAGNLSGICQMNFANIGYIGLDSYLQLNQEQPVYFNGVGENNAQIVEDALGNLIIKSNLGYRTSINSLHGFNDTHYWPLIDSTTSLGTSSYQFSAGYFDRLCFGTECTDSWDNINGTNFDTSAADDWNWANNESAVLDNKTIIRQTNTSWFYNLYYGITNRWQLANQTARESAYFNVANNASTWDMATADDWNKVNQTAKEAAYFNVANNASTWDMSTADEWQLANYTTYNASVSTAINLKVGNNTPVKFSNMTVTNTNTSIGKFNIIYYNSSCAGFRFGTTGGIILSCE